MTEEYKDGGYLLKEKLIRIERRNIDSILSYNSKGERRRSRVYHAGVIPRLVLSRGKN